MLHFVLHMLQYTRLCYMMLHYMSYIFKHNKIYVCIHKMDFEFTVKFESLNERIFSNLTSQQFAFTLHSFIRLL